MRIVRNCTFALLCIVALVTGRSNAQAFDECDLSCQGTSCSGECSSCGEMALACNDYCESINGVLVNLDCVDQPDPPTAIGSCSCWIIG